MKLLNKLLLWVAIAATALPAAAEITSVTLSPSPMTLYVGYARHLQLSVETTAAGVSSAVWQSSASNRATVDQNGLVTAVSKGTAVITVTVTDTDGSTSSATCFVTVQNNPNAESAIAEITAPDLTVSRQDAGTLFELPLTVTLPYQAGYTLYVLDLFLPEGLTFKEHEDYEDICTEGEDCYFFLLL